MERKLGKLKGKQSIPGIRGTFRTAGKAAEEFLRLNEGYFAPIAEESIDSEDLFIDWGDSQEVWVPRKGRGKGSLREEGYDQRLAETKKGQRVLDNSQTQAAMLRSVLTWIFSQTKSKRWADVDWHRVEALGDRLEQWLSKFGDEESLAMRMGQADLVYPAASGIYEGEQLALHPDVQANPKALAAVQSELNLAAIAKVKDQLEEAFAKAKPCLAPDVQRVIRGRIKYLKELERKPTRISAANICAHASSELSNDLIMAIVESGGELQQQSVGCVFPLLIEDSRRLAETCEQGYSVDWPVEEAGEWQEDPERFQEQLESTPAAVLRQVPMQAPVFDPEPEPIPEPEPDFGSFDLPEYSSPREAVEAFDDKEFEIFGPPADEEIPF